MKSKIEKNYLEMTDEEYEQWIRNLERSERLKCMAWFALAVLLLCGVLATGIWLEWNAPGW